MSEVTGIRQINNLLSPTMKTNRREDAERLEALLRNRKELIEALSEVNLNASDIEAGDLGRVAAILDKSKELDNA